MYASITCCPRLGCEYHWLPAPVPGETPDEPGWSPDEAQMNLDGLAGLAGPGREGDCLHVPGNIDMLVPREASQEVEFVPKPC